MLEKVQTIGLEVDGEWRLSKLARAEAIGNGSGKAVKVLASILQKRLEQIDVGHPAAELLLVVYRPDGLNSGRYFSGQDQTQCRLWYNFRRSSHGERVVASAVVWTNRLLPWKRTLLPLSSTAALRKSF